MNVSSKRAEYVSIAGLVLSILSFIVSFVVGSSCNSIAVLAVSWQILGGSIIWFILAVQFHQQSLAEQEKLDMVQLAKSKASDTIFQANDEQSELFAVASKRLELIEKWFVPFFAGLVAVYQILIGLKLFKEVSEIMPAPLQGAQLSAVFMVVIAFVSFLISRYATGMSAQARWKPLRAGGSMLLASAIFSFAVAISLALAQFKMFFAINILGWVVPIVMIVLGGEIALNLILDVYRPHIAGQYSRAAFDSRLLGVFNEPGGIFHTFASTIDYQFGFQVSQTWFYKLLEKAVIPLVLFLIFILYILSCVVVVRPGQEAVIERLGLFDKQVGPGVTFKLPWPVEKTYKYATSAIHRVDIGFIQSEEEKANEKNNALLWGEQHYEEEYDLLVATDAGGLTDDGAIPVSIVRAAVPVHYRIKDLKSYLYNHSDAEQMLMAICYRELVSFASSSKIEASEGQGGDISEDGILGGGRKEATRYLKRQIQSSADSMDLGIEIVFLGFQGVHPPPKVAEDYQKVVGSVQKRQAAILTALAGRNKALASLAGSVRESDDLYELAYRYQRAKDNGEDSEELAKAFEEAISDAKGVIFKILSEAKSYAFNRAKTAEADGKRFGDQVIAYQASPRIYQRLQRLEMLEEALVDVRKYVVVADEEDRQVYIVDLKEKLEPSLYDLDLAELEGK